MMSSIGVKKFFKHVNFNIIITKIMSNVPKCIELHYTLCLKLTFTTDQNRTFKTILCKKRFVQLFKIQSLLSKAFCGENVIWSCKFDL